MRSVIAALTFGLLFPLPTAATARLLTAVAVATVGEARYVAYEDNEVWYFQGPPLHLTHIDRDVPIKAMEQYGGTPVLLILYADDQLWMADWTGLFDFRADVSRSHAWVLDMSTENNNLMIFTYDDGQVWSLTSAGSFTREMSMEREAPTASIGDQSDRVALSCTALPNPFTDACRISYQNPSEGRVSIRILDASGRAVRRLLTTTLPAGEHSVIWDGRDDMGFELPAGVYLTRIETAETVAAGRVVLVR